MIKTKKSGAKYSAIVGIGEELRQRSKNENTEYLLLNRGINAVVNIDLSNIIPKIDFNSSSIQVYPPVKGQLSLRKAVNKAFFQDQASLNDIFITNGGVNALDLVFRTLESPKVLLPNLYWGAYINVLKINNIKYDFYPNLEYLSENASKLNGATVLICDPNNPSGRKFEDNALMRTLHLLDSEGVNILFDSPYRRLFYNWDEDLLYKQLLKFKNVIITESFSKSIGLSGLRVGFVHCKNTEFMQELAIKLLFSTNGINNFGQVLIEKLLVTKEGISAAENFRKITVDAIRKNIDYLATNNLIADEFYNDTKPWGIFVIINKSYNELLKYKIGSVPLNYFTQMTDKQAANFSRICVSVPHNKFVGFFNEMT